MVDVNSRRLFSLVEFGGFVESRNKDKVQDKYVVTADGAVPLRMGQGFISLLQFRWLIMNVLIK